MRGLVRGAVVVATRRRFAVIYLIPREISNAEVCRGAGPRDKISAMFQRERWTRKRAADLDGEERQRAYAGGYEPGPDGDFDRPVQAS